MSDRLFISAYYQQLLLRSPTFRKRLGSFSGFLRQRFQQRRYGSIVTERLADVGESIHVPRPKDEAGAKLKRVLAQLVLRMPGSACSLARYRIVASQKMKEISGLQLRSAIGLPEFINQKRESDAGLVTKLAGIDAVSQTNRGESRTFVANRFFVLAQLRGMLAAENSSIVAQKNDDRRLFVPQRSKSDLPSIAIRERNEGQLAAERTNHGAFIMSSALRGVKQLPRAGCSLDCLHELCTGRAGHRSLIAHKSASFVDVGANFRLAWN